MNSADMPNPIVAVGVPIQVWRFTDNHGTYYVMRRWDVPRGEKPEKVLLTPTEVVHGTEKIISFKDVQVLA